MDMDSLAEIIDAYTGLSPAAFLTILALMLGAYFLVSSCFFVHPDTVSPSPPAAADTPPKASPTAADQPPSPPPALMAEPVQLGDMTLDELSAYNGSDRSQPLLVSIRGDVYNVSRGCSMPDTDITTTPALPLEARSSPSPTRDDRDEPDAAHRVDLLLSRLATAVQYSTSVVQKGGFYGDKLHEMDMCENGVEGSVDLRAMSLRKLKGMYKDKLLRLHNSNTLLH